MIEARRIAGALGAEISGVDLSRPLSEGGLRAKSSGSGSSTW